MKIFVMVRGFTVLASLGTLTTASAIIIPVSIDVGGSASISWSNNNPSSGASFAHQQNATDYLGPLSVDVRESAIVDQIQRPSVTPGPLRIQSNSTQLVSLNSTGLVVEGSLFSSFSRATWNNVQASASSTFNLTFLVDTPTPFALDVSFDGYEIQSLFVPSPPRFFFNGLGLVLDQPPPMAANVSVRYSDTGVLQPGLYSIGFGTSTSTVLDYLGVSESAIFSVRLTTGTGVPDAGSSVGLLLLTVGLLTRVHQRID